MASKHAGAILALSLAATAIAPAQTAYPERTIKIVNPFPAARRSIRSGG